MTRKLALLTEIPAPFRIPLFNELAAADGIDLRVLFVGLRDPKRPYPLYLDEARFAWEVLPGRDVLRRPRWVVANVGVSRALSRFAPDAVMLGGWNQPAFWSAAWWARRHARPTLVWVESTSRDARSNLQLFERAKRRLALRAAAAVVPGRASAEYVASLGVAPERIATAPNAVDPAVFGARVDELRHDRDALRGALGIEGCTFLYAGRLDPEKGVDVLLRALERVPDARLVIAWHAGSAAAGLRATAPDRVRFVGPLDRDEIVRWYAAADAFVLPSLSDQWGMVLNEAATAGLPLVASEAAGASHDLIEHGINGFRVPPGDVAALGDALAQLCADGELRERAGARSRAIAAAFTPAAWATTVRDVVHEVVG